MRSSVFSSSSRSSSNLLLNTICSSKRALRSSFFMGLTFPFRASKGQGVTVTPFFWLSGGLPSRSAGSRLYFFDFLVSAMELYATTVRSCFLTRSRIASASRSEMGISRSTDNSFISRITGSSKRTVNNLLLSLRFTLIFTPSALGSSDSYREYQVPGK
jgi:hypothetical protein